MDEFILLIDIFFLGILEFFIEYSNNDKIGGEGGGVCNL